MDLATDTPATDSTVLDPGATLPGGSGGGTPNMRDQMRDTVADAVAKASEAADKAEEPAKADGADTDDAKPDAPEGKKAAEKGAEKPKEAGKAPDAREATKAPERGADGKFAGKDAPATETAPKAEADKPNGADKGDNIPAPSRFMPDAREKWTNTPRAVQRDVEHAFREHEAEVSRYREAAERYEPIRHYDEYVRKHGRAGIHETLEEVSHVSDLMETNPLAALNHMLLNHGPRKADGQPVSLFELAQAVVQMKPADYQRAVARPQQQQQPQNDNTEVTQLKQQVAALQQQTIAATVIEPFKRDHPRYDELSGSIAQFLKSGMVPASLSAPERLAVAYDMAERLYPPSGQTPAADGGPADERRADEPSAATSIKTAPGAVTPVEEPKRGGTARDEVERVIRRMTQTGGR